MIAKKEFDLCKEFLNECVGIADKDSTISR
jgi:hypothetical protein